LYDQWKMTNRGKLALVICFDQFTRMIYRGKDSVYKNDTLGFTTAQDLVETKNFLTTNEFTVAEKLFLLLPYRHQKDSLLLDFVLEQIDFLDNKFLDKQESDEKKLLKKFRLATYMSYTTLNDRITRYVHQNGMDDSDSFEFYKDVIDQKCFMILNSRKEEGKNIENYKNIEKMSIYQSFLSFIRENSIKNIGISLSGGVDSMVILFLSKIMYLSNYVDNVYALHLEYSNREESRKETELIGMYCDLLDIPLYTRVIDYMNRETVDRIFYEEETKKVRFHTYKFLSQKYDISGWCMGHHHGDITENVIMNMCNGRDLLDLGVMEKKTYFSEYGINLYRPLLDHPKSDIYEVSHHYFIPYLRDTTPDWSCRGVLRRKIIPELERQWPSVMDKFFSISQQSKEWSQVVEKFVLTPIKNSIQFNDEKTIINMEWKDEYKELPSVIWTNLFLYIFHRSKKNMITKKNLQHFLHMLPKNVEKKNRFIFSNKCIGIFMEKNLRILIF
jgi:tRNA(Ile)-lysidine synthetase-like protein